MTNQKGDGSVARRCSITGKGVMTNDNVNHANNRNKDGYTEPPEGFVRGEAR